MHAVTPKKLILEFGGFNIHKRLSMTGKSPLMNIKKKPEIRKRRKIEEKRGKLMSSSIHRISCSV